MKEYQRKALASYEKMLAETQPDIAGEAVLLNRLYERNFAPHLPQDPSLSILDLGCGFGHVLQFLQTKGYKNIQGVDLCPANVRICRQRGLPVTQADNREFLEAHPGQFDRVILSHLIEHYDKQSALSLLEAVHEALRDHGTALLVLPNMANPITAGRGRYADLTHESGYTEESVRFTLHLAGFAQVRVRPIDIYVLPNALLNFGGRIAAWCLFQVIRGLYLLNGVRSTKVFSKNMLVIARKGPCKANKEAL